MALLSRIVPEPTRNSPGGPWMLGTLGECDQALLLSLESRC